MCVFINAHKAPSNPSALKHLHICLESLAQQEKEMCLSCSPSTIIRGQFPSGFYH